ncbi:major facilitator superfamily domain-containing protein [Radiomyces spectabilis]|uniref:major facilitator superfamily domain-containing protein n=1 Tax=Radiomyces spectabilis TaxID=64574 RepID=UPI00221F29FA|nr:major facilitator superfamily domain-containing protein [Radiomyces spectabilis]KAI8364770.1 major facilitator superfamily domain-containing protein [Radiomyces spectabilis]
MGERYDPGANREITAKNDSQASASSPPSPPSKKASQDPDPSSSSIPHSSKPTPLPKLQMFVICTLLFSEPLTSTVLFPFIYFMLKDFHLSDDEKEIGAYAGWITSIFFVAQFCTAIGWGKISDRYGRRPVLLIGLIGNSVSSCLFGVSKSLWWAVCTRAFCGIVNGNNGVARSMVSEITDTSNRAKAFSMFGFCWGIGMIGGYLCQPAQQFPNVFGDWQFFIEYPYFLPCLVSSLGSLFGFFVGYFYLKESNPAVLARQRAHKTKKYGGSAEEHTALLEGHNHCHSHPCPQKQAEEQEEQTDGIFTSLRKITPASMACIVAYSAYAFHCMVFDEILPLYFSAPRYAGGLGSNSRELAKALSITGLQQLFFQFVLFPPLNRVWNTLILSRFSLITLVPVYALMPELSTLQEWLFAHMTDAFARQWTFRFAYMTLLFIRYSLNCMALTSLIIMVSESAAPEVLGTVNG